MEYQKEKVAIVTGGNSGIGFQLTQELLAAGYRVIITSRSGKVENLAHPALAVVQVDLANRDSFEAADAKIGKLTRHIDLLVNNAGVADDIHLEIPTYETFYNTMAVNLTGTICFAEILMPLLSADALIVNISSEMGLLENADKNAPAYRVAKAGLNMYTKILAKRFANTSTRAIAIHPGWVNTKLGGPLAPMDAKWSAELVYMAILRNSASGNFINAHTKQEFAL